MRRSTPLRAAILATLAVFLAIPAAPAASGPVSKGLVFGTVGARKLRLDIYYPKAPSPPGGYPLVISIHGGGWLFGDRHRDLFLRDLTGYGYAVASIDYRLSLTAKYPAQIEDTREALKWLVGNARSLHLDANRVGVTGASAGAQLALVLGLSQPASAHGIKAICALYPPTDLVSIIPPDKRSHRDNLVAELLGAPVSERLELARKASPMTYVGGEAPPVLIFHGDRDHLVPIGQSKSLNSALQRAGAVSSLIVCPGKGHGFGLDEDQIATAARFFDRYLKDRRRVSGFPRA